MTAASKPVDLKTRFLLRKVAKMLGMKRNASPERVVAELRRTVAALEEKRQAAATGGTAPLSGASGDLDAALQRLTSLLPVRKELAAAQAAAPLHLPAPLQAVKTQAAGSHNTSAKAPPGR